MEKLSPSSRGLVLALTLLSSSAWAQDADGDGAPDATDLFPCDASAAGVYYAPAESETGRLVFEDQWPEQGDLDFDDAVIAFHYAMVADAVGRVVTLRTTFTPLALGGRYHNGLGLHLPVPAGAVTHVSRALPAQAPVTLQPSSQDAELTVRISDDLREFFGGQTGQINSRLDLPRLDGTSVVVEVTFAEPISLDVGAAPFDVFLFRTSDPSHEIHTPDYAGTAAMNTALFGTGQDASHPGRAFVDSSGLPFGLVFPEPVRYAREASAISLLYPDIVNFAASGGVLARDFYRTTVDATYAYSDIAGRPALDAPAPPPAHDGADTSCVAPICAVGTEDCDGVPGNGCEANLQSSNAHCGACGQACAGGQSCYSGVCRATCGGSLPAFPAGCVNITPQGAAAASRSYGATQPSGALDGTPCGTWNAGGYAPQWWSVDFGAPRTFERIWLMPGMSPSPAAVRHVVEVSDDGVQWTGILDIQQTMASASAHDFDLGGPVTARRVRVRTVASPSWVAWFEVGVLSCP